MTEAMKPIVRFGWERMSLHSLEGHVHTENQGSIRVLEKLGFQREAHFALPDDLRKTPCLAGCPHRHVRASQTVGWSHGAHTLVPDVPSALANAVDSLRG